MRLERTVFCMALMGVLAGGAHAQTVAVKASPVVQIGDQTFGTALATCEGGYYAASGGWECKSANPATCGAMTVTRSARSADNSWEIRAYNGGSAPVSLQAFATCVLRR